MSALSGLKAAWHTDRIDQLREGRDIVPTQVQLIICDLCNQDCHFCAYRMSGGFSTEHFADADGNRNPKRWIPTGKAKEILDDCAKLGVGGIQFTGGGEPTVHPDHIEIIGHAQTLGLETGLVTNGVRLSDHEVFQNLTWLRISVDAGTEATYEAIRESKAWPKVMNNLKIAGSFRKPYTGMGFVITRENCGEITQACEIARAAGLQYIRLSAMFSTEGMAYYDGLFQKIRWKRDSARRLEDETFQIVDFFDDRISDLDQGRPDYHFCGMQQFVLYIGGDQKVYTCCTNSYTGHGEIGDLTNQTFADWLATHRRFDFDATGCHTCQFNDKNRLINYLVDPRPPHVDFV